MVPPRLREQLILDTAQNMLHEHGYVQLTMERIAEAVEYSKGTIYNHFSSKEDLVCSLCCRCVSNLIDLFKRAYDYPGSTRERFSAIGIAYTLYHQLNPLDAQNIQVVKTNAVREKLSDEKLQEIIGGKLGVIRNDNTHNNENQGIGNKCRQFPEFMKEMFHLR